MRIVADQVQFVVQIVFTTSSNSVALWTQAPRAAGYPAQIGIGRSDAVEFRIIAVQVHDAAHARGEFRLHGGAAQAPGRGHAREPGLPGAKFDDRRAAARETQRHAQRVAFVGHLVGR